MDAQLTLQILEVKSVTDYVLVAELILPKLRV